MACEYPAESASQQEALEEHIDPETEPGRYAIYLTSKHVPFRARKQMPQVARRAQAPDNQQASGVNRRFPMPLTVFPTLKIPSQQPKSYQFPSQSEKPEGLSGQQRGVGDLVLQTSCEYFLESMERPLSSLTRSGEFRRSAVSIQRPRSGLYNQEELPESSDVAPPQSPGRSHGTPPPAPLLDVQQQIPQPPSLQQQIPQPPSLQQQMPQPSKSPQPRSPGSPPAATSSFLQQLQAGRGGLKGRSAPAPQQLPKSPGSPKPQSPGWSDRTFSPHLIQDIPQSPIPSQPQSLGQSNVSPPAATSSFLKQLQAGRGGLRGKPPVAPKQIPPPPNLPQLQSPRSPPVATSSFLQQLQAGRGGLKGKSPVAPQQIPSPPNLPQPQSPRSPPAATSSFLQQLQAGRGGLKGKPPVAPQQIPSPPNLPQYQSPRSPPAATSSFLRQLQTGRGGLKGKPPVAPQKIPSPPISPKPQSPCQPSESPPAACSNFMQQLQAGRGGLKRRPPISPRSEQQ